LQVAKSRESYPALLRGVVALVEIEGKQVEMTFLTNNLDWSASSVADLYRCRWSIEVFFKQIKQTLQLSDFQGHSANAVRWQVWTALLVYALPRFQACLSCWGHSFTRLFALVRSVLWRKIDLPALLRSYGTATSPHRSTLLRKLPKILNAPFDAIDRYPKWNQAARIPFARQWDGCDPILRILHRLEGLDGAVSVPFEPRLIVDADVRRRTLKRTFLRENGSPSFPRGLA
jgi:hypothetical protein